MFISILNKRNGLIRNSEDYKDLTKKLKKQVNKLNNEAKEINQYSSRKQIEDLYRTFKADNSSFKEIKTSNRCEPQKLKEYFKQHFQAKSTNGQPIELDQLPEFIKKLQDIPMENVKTGPSDITELRGIIKKIKSGKSSSDVSTSFIKHAFDSKEFAMEIVKLYRTVWLTKLIPREWGHSRLNAI